MPIPEWNQYGLLPQGIHDCCIDEVSGRLGFNPRRQQLIAGLRKVIGWLEEMPPAETLIIDGSFVTDKESPGDIDAVAVISDLTEPEQKEWIGKWQQQKELLKQNHEIDLYPMVAGKGNNFVEFFQYIRPEEALDRGAPVSLTKGLLRIVQ